MSSILKKWNFDTEVNGLEGGETSPWPERGGEGRGRLGGGKLGDIKEGPLLCLFKEGMGGGGSRCVDKCLQPPKQLPRQSGCSSCVSLCRTMGGMLQAGECSKGGWGKVMWAQIKLFPEGSPWVLDHSDHSIHDQRQLWIECLQHSDNC